MAEQTPPLQVLNVKSKPLVRGTTALETCISDVSLKKNLLDAVVIGLRRTGSPIKQKKNRTSIVKYIVIIFIQSTFRGLNK